MSMHKFANAGPNAAALAAYIPIDAAKPASAEQMVPISAYNKLLDRVAVLERREQLRSVGFVVQLPPFKGARD